MIYWNWIFILDGLDIKIENLRNTGYKKSGDFCIIQNDNISVDGLIGVDVIKICHMQLIDRMNGQAFEFSQRIVHFGNIADFLFLEGNDISKEISVFKNSIYY